MRFYIHGNCQAPAMADLIREVSPDLVVASREVFSLDLEADRDGYVEDISMADVIFTQPVSPGYRGVEWLGSDWLVSAAKPSAKIFTFPVVYHRGMLPQCFPLPGLYHSRLAYHDAHALDYYLRGRTAREFLADSSELDFLPARFILSEALESTLELLRRERAANVDAVVSDILAERQQFGQSLFVVNHPDRAVLAGLTNKLLRLANAPFSVNAEGRELLDQFIFPPYLSVLRSIKHSGQDIRFDRVRFDQTDEPREIFFEKVFRSYRDHGEAILGEAMAGSDLSAYLARYHRARREDAAPRKVDATTWLERLLGRRSPPIALESSRAELVVALYRLFLGREPGEAEIMQHLNDLDRDGYERLLLNFASAPEFASAGGGDALMRRAAVGRL